MNGPDRLIQGMAGGGDFRIIAAQTTETVENGRELLDLAPVAADALGRALTGSLILARLLDKALKNQYVTLRFEGDGPLGVVIAEGTVAGHARGWVANPVPTDAALDVPRALGRGRMTVVRGVPPEGRPYTSQLLTTGSGIAKDITRYLHNSEQITSAVLLGVLNRRDGVAAAGGGVIQAFPHATDEWIRTRSGVQQRYYVRDGVGSAELGIEAADKALAAAGRSKDDIDAVIFATMTPNFFFPGNGPVLQAKMGFRESMPTFDIRQQCSGFLYGLDLADSLIRSGKYR